MTENNNARRESSAQSTVARIEIPDTGDFRCPYCGGRPKDCVGGEEGYSWEWNCSVCGNHFLLKPRVIMTYESSPDRPLSCCYHSDHIRLFDEELSKWGLPDVLKGKRFCRVCRSVFGTKTKMFVEFVPEGEHSPHKTKSTNSTDIIHSTIERKEFRTMQDLRCPYCESKEHRFVPDWSFPNTSVWSCMKCRRYFTTKTVLVVTCEASDGGEVDLCCPYCSRDEISTTDGKPATDSCEVEWFCYSCGGIFKTVEKTFIEFKLEDSKSQD
jgi:DNA-directed RNA polymerase subunit RPC12/RpoP